MLDSKTIYEPHEIYCNRIKRIFVQAHIWNIRENVSAGNSIIKFRENILVNYFIALQKPFDG